MLPAKNWAVAYLGQDELWRDPEVHDPPLKWYPNTLQEETRKHPTVLTGTSDKPTDSHKWAGSMTTTQPITTYDDFFVVHFTANSDNLPIHQEGFLHTA